MGFLPRYILYIYIPWEPKTFIFRGYNPYIGGVKPSFFMVLGSKGIYVTHTHTHIHTEFSEWVSGKKLLGKGNSFRKSLPCGESQQTWGRFCKWDVFFAPAECFGTETMLFTVSSFNYSFNDFNGWFQTTGGVSPQTWMIEMKPAIEPAGKYSKYDFSKTLTIIFWVLFDSDDTFTRVLETFSGLISRHPGEIRVGNRTETTIQRSNDPIWASQWIHPRKLTCPPKRHCFNRKDIFQPLIFKRHFNFLGCTTRGIWSVLEVCHEWQAQQICKPYMNGNTTRGIWASQWICHECPPPPFWTSALKKLNDRFFPHRCLRSFGEV